MKKLTCVLTLLLMLLPVTGGVSRSAPAINANAGNQKFNMSYIYFGSPGTYADQVDQTKNSLDMVSPNYFDITEEGMLDVTWKLQSSFIEQMHERGMKVVPFLSNHWKRENGINAMMNRTKLAQQIADAVQTYNLDGVDVDIEGITVTYRAEFTDFIRILRSLLPEGKMLSVAVAANPNGWNTGWHGLYDYKQLASYADYLMIMAYDESWEGSGPGPVASLGFAESSIAFAIEQQVPGHKIVLGVPFYGRVWKDDGLPNDEGKIVKGTGVSMFRVDPIIQKYNGRVTFDYASRSPYARFTIPAGQTDYAGSTKLTAGSYTVWFENEASIKSKLRLAGKYGIRGSGSWSLYQENKEVWDYYKLWINGRFYTDVPIGYWAEDDIIAMSDIGWMQGVASTRFAPAGRLTRAQGAAIIVRAMGLESRTPKQYLFQDVPADHWARQPIELAREYGFVQGTGASAFSPDAPLPREQLAVILARVLELKPSEEGERQVTFKDVAEDAYYRDAVAAMQEKHIVQGISEELFGVGKVSTRAEMSALMNRLKETIDARRTALETSALQTYDEIRGDKDEGQMVMARPPLALNGMQRPGGMEGAGN